MDSSRKDSAAPAHAIAPDASSAGTIAPDATKPSTMTVGANTTGKASTATIAPGQPNRRASAPASGATQATGVTATAEGEPRQVGKGEDRRKSVLDRRNGVDRRQQTRAEAGYTGPERRSGDERREDTGLERRRGPGRRRSDDRKAAEEGEMTSEQFEFCMAIETYKKVNKKMFPTWTEVLEVVRHLGYRKVEQRDINLDNCPEPKLDQKTGNAKNAA